MEDTGFEPDGILRLCKGPWTALAGGGIVLVATFCIQQVLNISAIPLVFVGILAVMAGVCIRPTHGLVLLASSGCALLAVGSLPLDWDSMHLLLIVLAAVAAVCALIVTLSRVARRVIVSCLILFHFAGITCAVMNTNPAPWLASYLWAHCFHHYLSFIHMTNPYHFYSPEPAPGKMLWFNVRYDDGSNQWVKLPVRENQRWLLNYQRRLSLPDHVNQLVNAQTLPGDEIMKARILAGDRDGIGFYYGQPRPTDYRFANTWSQIMLGSYAHHIAATTLHPTEPNRRVVGVKVYRVVHRMMTPKETALGLQPDKKWMYLPYYQGEFDFEGKLKNPSDPYLYWLIPIVNKRNPYLSSGEAVTVDSQAALHQDDDIVDCLTIHASLPTILPLNAPNQTGERDPKPKK